LANRQPVTKVEIPADSKIADSIDRIEYSDAYAKEIAGADIDTILKSIFLDAPQWIGVLAKLRDQAVSIFALKPCILEPGQLKAQKSFKVGDRLGIFRIRAKNNQEIVMGENDKHLDFCVSLHLCPILESAMDSHRQTVTLSTVVRFNTLFGRVYFAVIKPFHKIIVQTLLERLS